MPPRAAGSSEGTGPKVRILAAERKEPFQLTWAAQVVLALVGPAWTASTRVPTAGRLTSLRVACASVVSYLA